MGDVGAGDTERLIIKQVVLDDVKYDIIVKPFSDEIYQASWRCSACHEDGAWAPLSGDAHQAVELAISGLEAHHGFLHGRARMSRSRPR